MLGGEVNKIFSQFEFRFRKVVGRTLTMQSFFNGWEKQGADKRIESIQTEAIGPPMASIWVDFNFLSVSCFSHPIKKIAFHNFLIILIILTTDLFFNFLLSGSNAFCSSIRIGVSVTNGGFLTDIKTLKCGKKT